MVSKRVCHPLLEVMYNPFKIMNAFVFTDRINGSLPLRTSRNHREQNWTIPKKYSLGERSCVVRSLLPTKCFRVQSHCMVLCVSVLYYSFRPTSVL